MTDEHTPEEEPPPSTAGRGRFREQAADILYRLDRAVGEHGAWMSEADPRLDDVEKKVAALTGRVDAIAGRKAGGSKKNTSTKDDGTEKGEENRAAALLAHGLGPEPTPEEPVEPVCWPVLDAEQAAVVWEALATWVGEVIVPQHQPTRGQLPDCWPLHPPAVAALTWAWETYRISYTLGTADRRAEWATRWWPGALEVIRNAIDPTVCPPNWHLMNDDQRRDELQQSSEDRAQRLAEAGETRFADAVAAHRQNERPQDTARRAEQEQQRRDRVAERRAITGAGRPRRLPWEHLSDIAQRRDESLASRASAPRLWMPQVREAATEDLAARRAGKHLSPRTNYSLSGDT